MQFELESVEALASILEENGIAAPHEYVHVDDLFSQSFMRRNTEFGSIDEFFARSPWNPTSEREVAAIPDEKLDAYVARHTSFENWQEMVQQGVLELFNESG